MNKEIEMLETIKRCDECGLQISELESDLLASIKLLATGACYLSGKRPPTLYANSDVCLSCLKSELDKMANINQDK